MAVPEQTPYIEHTGNGVTTSFALKFQCESKDHLIVLIDDIEPPIETWSLSYGNVIFTTAPAAGKKITAQRNTPFSRNVDYQSYNNSFRPPAVNKDFDWIWWKLQELGVADWILSNRINDLRAYVDKQDDVLQDNIDSLKNYVDDKDDELRNYLLNAIQEQGVALDQLEEYYSYLMQQLAQVAIDRGWAALFIVSADGSNQQQVNDRIGNTWYEKPLGYELNARVMLTNGDIVKSTVANNTVNPNVDMTGWVRTNSTGQIFTAYGRTQEQKNDEVISFLDFDKSIPTDGLSDASAKIQAVINQQEIESEIPYYFFPTTKQNYLLSSPLTLIKNGLLVFGFKAPTYNRQQRKGWFLVDNNQCGFDVGGSTNTQRGDSWTFRNIGFKPSKTALDRVPDGVRITATLDGPERGWNFDGVTFSVLNRGIYVANGAGFMAATVSIQNSVLCNNNYAFYGDQKVDGFRFVGNQCEQNIIGAIKLKGAGGINISDNMMEGQPNAIEIDGWSVQSGSQVEIRRNYFERNFGDFLISYKDTSYGKGVLEITNNQIADFGLRPNNTVDPTDFCRIYNSQYNYGYTILNREAYPITFMDDATVLPQSILSGKLNSYYIQKGFNGNLGSKVFTDNFVNLINDPAYVDMTTRGASVETYVNTQFGIIAAPNTADYLVANVNAQAGDVISVNILFKSDFSDDFMSALNLYVRETNETLIHTMGSANASQDVNNKYIVGTWIFKMPSAKTGILLRVGNAIETSAIQMIAGCFKNHGQFTAPLKIRQVLPKITSVSAAKFSVTQQDIPANGVRSVSYTLTGANLSDFINTSYNKLLKPNIDIEAYVSADNTVTVNFKNTTASMVTMPAGDLLIKRSKT